MPTYTPIYVRSPRLIEMSGVANDSTKVELYIWNDPDSQPASPTYTLSKPIPSTNITSAWYDISPYCREYINHVSYAEVTDLTGADFDEYCYCTVMVYKNDVLQSTNYYIAFDGFGYFEDGKNPSPITSFLVEGRYYVNETGNTGGLFYHNDQTATWEATYTGLTTGGSGTITLTHEVGYIPYVFPTYAGEGNKLEIKKNSVVQATYYFEEVCEPKYTPLNCDFVNRYGQWQRIVMFKASRQSMEMSNTEYHLMPADVDYGLQDNRKQVFNVNGQRSIRCNTGWVLEGYKEAIKDLLLSEKVLIDDEPVKLKTKGVELFEHITEKLINYEIEFDYSHNMLNYII